MLSTWKLLFRPFSRVEATGFSAREAVKCKGNALKNCVGVALLGRAVSAFGKFTG
jgi:hypothetical protein